MVNSEIILSNVVFGVPSGNYDGSSQDWYSDAVQAANYYRGRGGLQTLMFHVAGFIGTIQIQATLDTVPTSVDTKWFLTNTYSSNSPLTDYHPINITGNFSWIRLRVENFDAGTINSVTISY